MSGSREFNARPVHWLPFWKEQQGGDCDEQSQDRVRAPLDRGRVAEGNNTSTRVGAFAAIFLSVSVKNPRRIADQSPLNRIMSARLSSANWTRSLLTSLTNRTFALRCPSIGRPLTDFRKDSSCSLSTSDSGR